MTETQTDTITAAARATAEAWADQCFGRMPGRDVGYGNSPTEGMAMAVLMLAAASVPQGGSDERAKFIEATTEHVAAGLRSQAEQGRDWGVMLSTDYGPGYEWREIIAKSGVHPGAFPMKSMSSTTTNYVTAQFGYGRADTLVWTAPDYEIPPCMAREYDEATYKPTGKACNLKRWHEGDHNNLAEAPPRDW